MQVVAVKEVSSTGPHAVAGQENQSEIREESCFAQCRLLYDVNIGMRSGECLNTRVTFMASGKTVLLNLRTLKPSREILQT